MKVTFITPTLEVHGGTLVLHRYAHALTHAGHNVTVIGANRGTHHLTFAPTIDVKTYRPLPHRYGDFVTFQLFATSALTRLIDTSDLIIPIYMPLLVPTLIATKRRQHTARIVPLCQDSLEIPLTGHYLKTILRHPAISRNLHGGIAVSHGIKMQYEQLLKRDLITIPNGIDHDIFTPQPTKTEFAVLFVGRPNAAKGFPVFVRAVHELQKTYPTLKAWVIAPSFPTHAPAGITFIPYENRDQLANYYRRATAYVNASRAESFGLPPLEAMACGTPVVMTQTVGSYEYAEHRTNCLLVPPGNATALQGAIQELLDTPKLRMQLSTNGETTAARYTWPRAEAKFLQYLSELTNA